MTVLESLSELGAGSGRLAIAAAVAGIAVHAGLAGRRIRVRAPRRPRPARVSPAVTRSLSFLGAAVALSSGPAVAGTRSPVSPHRRVSEAAPPWSEAGGFPPPRPLARTGMGAPLGGRAVHPAVHARRPVEAADNPVPLFPRAPHSERSADDDRREAMRRHPSGKAVVCRSHVVRPGDSLWSIAEEVLGTKDPRSIARYWPRLHRANRATIGPDPRLIRPGQVLELPRCE